MLVELARVRETEGLSAERSRWTTLAQAEIDRIAAFGYAHVLAADEAFTTDGAATMKRWCARWLPG